MAQTGYNIVRKNNTYTKAAINGEMYDYGLESLILLSWPCTPNPTDPIKISTGIFAEVDKV